MERDLVTAGTASGHSPGVKKKMDLGARVASVVKANCGRCVVNLVGPPGVLDQIGTSFRFWVEFNVGKIGLEVIGGGVSFRGNDEVMLGGDVRRAFMVEPTCVGDVEFMVKHTLATTVVPLTYDGKPVLTAAILGRTMILRTDQGIFAVQSSATLITVFNIGGDISPSTTDVAHQAADMFDSMTVKHVDSNVVVQFKYKADRCVGDCYIVTVINSCHRDVKMKSTYELKPEVVAERERDRLTSGSYRPVGVRRRTAADIPGAMAVGSRPHLHSSL